MKAVRYMNTQMITGLLVYCGVALTPFFECLKSYFLLNAVSYWPSKPRCVGGFDAHMTDSQL